MLQVAIAGTVPVWYTMLLQFVIAMWPIAAVWVISKAVVFIWEIERGVK